MLIALRNPLTEIHLHLYKTGRLHAYIHKLDTWMLQYYTNGHLQFYT